MDDRLLLADIFDKVDMDNASEFRQTLESIEMELHIYQERFRQQFRYCVGCKGFVKANEVYEGICYLPVNEKGLSRTRPILKCCNCNSVIKFLD
jgi:hypothetical protein